GARTAGAVARAEAGRFGRPGPRLHAARGTGRMIRHSFPIYFDDNPPLDRVALAVVPMDAFSGRLVTSGVKVSVLGQLARPIKSLSGQLVFINLPVEEKYRVNVDPSEAGYFSPPESEFPDPDDPDAKVMKRHLVKLIRRPDFPFEGTTTLIRG